jgi:hypothetical protein
MFLIILLSLKIGLIIEHYPNNQNQLWELSPFLRVMDGLILMLVFCILVEVDCSFQQVVNDIKSVKSLTIVSVQGS